MNFISYIIVGRCKNKRDWQNKFGKLLQTMNLYAFD